MVATVARFATDEPARSLIEMLPVVEPGSQLIVYVVPADNTSLDPGAVIVSNPAVWQDTGAVTPIISTRRCHIDAIFMFVHLLDNILGRYN